MEQAKRVAKNTGFLYAQMGITVFMSLYATRLILAALGAEDFGIFNVVGGAIAMLTFLNAAMTSASQRFMSFAQGAGNVEKQKSIFNISVVLHFFIAIAVVIILEIAGYFLFGSILNIAPERLYVAKLIYQFLIASTFFTIISVPYDAVINAHENMLFVAILRVLEVTLKLGIAFFITYTSFDKLLSFGLLMACLSIFLLLIRQFYCRKKYKEAAINIKKYYDQTLFNEMTSFASWSFLGASSSMITMYGQGILVNVFFGTVVNAAQGIAGQISGQLSAFAVTMLKALNPVLAKSEGANDRKLMIKATFIGTKIAVFLLMFLYIPVIIEMPYIFSLWLKEVPEYAVVFCRLLLICDLIGQLFVTISSSINAVGKIKKFQLYSSILTFSPLVISAILFYNNFSPVALYYVFIFYALCRGLLILYFANVTFSLSIKSFLEDVLSRVFIVFVIGMSISLIPTFLMQESIYRLGLVLLISTTSFLFSVWQIGLKSEEKQMFMVILLAMKDRIMKVIYR